jgi:hypothetical protein
MKERSRTNRILLGLLGLVLLGGGLTVLAAAADIFRRWDIVPPQSWPLTGPQDVLVPLADQNRWAGQGWWWPTVISALAVLMLLALWWLLAQFLRHRARWLSTAGGSGLAVRIDDHVLDNALAADLGALPGVERARVRLTGTPATPHAQVGLTLTPDSTPSRVLDDVRNAVDRARRSAGWDELPARATLRVARHPAHRVE